MYLHNCQVLLHHRRNSDISRLTGHISGTGCRNRHSDCASGRKMKNCFGSISRLVRLFVFERWAFEDKQYVENWVEIGAFFSEDLCSRIPSFFHPSIHFKINVFAAIWRQFGELGAFLQSYDKLEVSRVRWATSEVRKVIWKWDVLDSSSDYPLLNSKYFISNYPAIWQKLSNIENIINLINYENGWRNLKTKCMLHNYSLYSMDMCRNHLNPSSVFGGVARKRNSALILPWNNSYANEPRGDMTMRCLGFN
jgi:hypothetical protein